MEGGRGSVFTGSGTGSQALSEARQEPSLTATRRARQGKGWDPAVLPENEISASSAAILQAGGTEQSLTTGALLERLVFTHKDEDSLSSSSTYCCFT